MKKLVAVLLALVMVFSIAGCSNEPEAVDTADEPQTTEAPTAEPTAEPVQAQDWEYDESSKTLYVNVDMGAFEPDAPDFDGTTSNAPWAEYLPEIENIVVGDDVSFIGDYAFAFCPNLRNVEVGQNVGALDFRCFFKCGDFDNDSNIDFHFNSAPSYGDDAFGYTWDNPNVMIYVPDDMKGHWADYVMQKGEMQLDGYDMQPQGQEKDEALFTNLMNPTELWHENSDGFSENNGGEFGGGVAMGYNADMQRLEIFGEDTGACAQFNTSIMTCMSDVGMNQNPQQAVIVKFSSPDITNGVRFSFEAHDELTFSFREDGIYFTDVANFFEMPISDFMPNNFEMKNDAVYYFFFAFDANGDIRIFVWEEGMMDNQAYFEYDLYQDANDINSCDIMMHLGVDENNQFNIYEYWVYTFENYMDGTSYLVNADGGNGDMHNDNNGDNEYGPFWSINVGGDFDIMSDMVWQSIDVQDFKIGSGDTFKGYVLKDMMDLSGHGTEKASVTFKEPGIENAEIDATYDAFIVYMQNDELMGGPYLLTLEGLWEYQVLSVEPK